MPVTEHLSETLTLKEHFETLILERDKRTIEWEKRIAEKFESDKAFNTAQYEAQKEAITKAEVSVETRLKQLNEIRAILSDQQATLVRKTEVEAMISNNTSKIDDIKERMDRQEGKTTGINLAGVVIAQTIVIILMMLGIGISLLYHH